MSSSTIPTTVTFLLGGCPTTGISSPAIDRNLLLFTSCHSRLGFVAGPTSRVTRLWGSLPSTSSVTPPPLFSSLGSAPTNACPVLDVYPCLLGPKYFVEGRRHGVSSGGSISGERAREVVQFRTVGRFPVLLRGTRGTSEEFVKTNISQEDGDLGVVRDKYGLRRTL